MIIIASCDKKGTTQPTSGKAPCRLTMISSQSTGHNGGATYEYDNDGRLITITNYSGNSPEAITTLSETSMVSNYTSSAGFPMVQTIVFEGGGLFNGYLPSKSSMAQQEGTITHTQVRDYLFYYDSKDRIGKVSEVTPNAIGDWEWDLFISYDDHDNVTSLKYEWNTGPNTSTIIPATGYDDKPSPYSGLRTWKYLANWDGDVLTMLAQLSKNNPLGFIQGDWTRKITYEYNENGYPIIQNNKQFVKGNIDTARWVENFNYVCQ